MAMVLAGCNNTEKAPQVTDNSLNNLTDSMSYSLGYTIGKNIIKQFVDDSVNLNIEKVLIGINNSISEDTTAPLLVQATIDSLTQQLQTVVMEKQQAKMEEQRQKFEERSKTAAEDGKKFFAENKNKPGIISDKAGFQYRIITEGKGEKPTEENTIKFHLLSKFLDGEEIQSTLTGQPIEMPLMYGSPPMIELLKKMTVGSK